MKKIIKTISTFLVILMTFTTLCLSPENISLIKAEAASFNDINNSSVFIKGTSGRCTLASAVMMVRRTAMATGNTGWANITENSMKSSAWIDGQGLRRSFSYSGISVKHAYLSSNIDNASELRDILNNHPEGIVLYNADYPHAILLTDYTNGIFYCADPDLGPSKGRIPITEAYKQKVTINNADR